MVDLLIRPGHVVFYRGENTTPLSTYDDKEKKRKRDIDRYKKPFNGRPTRILLSTARIQVPH